MTENTERLLEEVLSLSDGERHDLIVRLLEATDSDAWGFATPEIAASWDAEIARRIEEIDSGKVRTLPWEEVRRELWGIIGKSPS